MKNFKIFTLFILALVGLNSCETEDDVIFVAQEPGEFALTNTLLPEYILTSTTGSNIGERFTWNTADFGVPTNISYDLQRSVSGDFTDAVLIGSTTGNEIAMTIGQMMAAATDAGLSADAENTGSFSIRVRAYAGDGASSTTEVFSEAKTISVVIQKAETGGSGITISSWGIVGDGYNNWGSGGPDGQLYSTSTPDVFVGYVTLRTGEIKFRENNDWGNNIGDNGGDGTLESEGANIPVTAGNYKITLNLNDNTYSIEEFSWGVVGDAYNNWGEDGPDAKFYYDYTTDTFKIGVRLINGEIKFRTNNAWGNDLGGTDGTLGSDNIPVTAGHYAITLDFNANTYTIEEADIYGIVGSGYNNWGEDGPDFALTEVQPDIWVGDIVTLIDGQIKFRQNNAWSADFGDDGADGTLDAGGADIDVVAGEYRVVMDLINNTYHLHKLTE